MIRRPRIALVGPIGARGGIATVMRLLAGSDLLRRRYRIETVHTSDGREARAGRQLLVFLRSLVSLAWLCARGVDVVHLHASIGPSFWRKAALSALSRGLGTKTILHLHSGGLDAFVSGRGRLARLAMSRVLEGSDLVVVLTETWGRRVLDAFPGVAAERLVAVRNPIETAPPAAIENVGGAAGRLIYLGALASVKGLADLLDAVGLVTRDHPAVSLTLCGTGPEEDRLREQVAALAIEDRVEFAGWVRGEEKWRRLRESSIFVLPSYGEGMPVALLEAMSAGLPVVTTRIIGTSQIVNEGRNGLLFDPGDVGGLAAKLRRLLEDDGLRRSMGSHNEEDAGAFRTEEVARVWDAAYTALAAGEPAEDVRRLAEQQAASVPVAMTAAAGDDEGS
ncbi:MAG: glycosyltransferase family 1 protein [Actinobacteria bacterium]|nr:MAG: glycosyltransferase family 1 protein [Actinomycetota bacterium]